MKLFTTLLSLDLISVLLLLSSFFNSVYAQQQKQEDDVDYYTECFNTLQKSDQDHDEYLNQDEYIYFIQQLGEQKCKQQQQKQQLDAKIIDITFNELATTEYDDNNNDVKYISIAGVVESNTKRTPEQLNDLTSICLLAVSTIDELQCQQQQQQPAASSVTEERNMQDEDEDEETEDEEEETEEDDEEIATTEDNEEEEDKPVVDEDSTKKENRSGPSPIAAVAPALVALVLAAFVCIPY